MNTILLAVIPVFALIAIGYGLKRSNFLPLDQWVSVERLSIHVLYPGFLIPSIWGANLSGGSAAASGMAAIASVVVVGGAVLALKPFLPISGPAFTSVFQGSVRWNSFVFLPVIRQVFGQHGLALAAIMLAVLIPFINIAAVMVMVRWGEGQAGTSPRHMARAMFQNPILVACLMGLALNFAHVPTIPGVSDLLKLLGDAALPLGLLIAGAGLAFTDMASRPWVLGITSLVKVTVMPFLMYGFARLFGADPMTQGVALLCGAAPGAAASYVLSRQMGGDSPLMAGIIALTTCLSAVVIPVLLAVFHYG